MISLTISVVPQPFGGGLIEGEMAQLLEYGALIALALLVIWVALLIPLAQGRLKAVPFGTASIFLALMIPLFWLGPEVTRLAILKVGSFKTNAEQATKYFTEISKVHAKVEAERQAVNSAVTSFNKEMAAAQAEIKIIRAKVETDEQATNAATASLKADAQAHTAIPDARAHTEEIQSPLADRKLTDAQVEKIANKLVGFKGQEFGIVPYWELRESLSIAKRIVKALTTAKWKFTPPAAASFLTEGISGVLVYANPRASDKTKKATSALVLALNDEGIIAALRKTNASSPEDKIELRVGTKP
jgi:hypothetical protein